MPIKMNITQSVFGKQAEIRVLFMLLSLCMFCENILAQERENVLQNILTEIQESRPIGRMEIRYYGGIFLPGGFSPTQEEFDKLKYGGMLNTKAKAHIKNFKQALKNTKVTEGERGFMMLDTGGDLSWGITLFDEKDQLIASIYFDAFLHHPKIIMPSGDKRLFFVILESKNHGKGLPSWIDSFLELFSPTTGYFRKYCIGKRPNIDGLSDEERSIDAFIKDLTALCSQNDED